MTTASRPSFWFLFVVHLKFLAVPLLVELIVYLSRPEIYPSYLPLSHRFHSILFVFIFYAILCSIASLLFTLIQKIFPQFRMILVIPPLLFFLFYALSLSRLLPTESGISIFRIAIFITSFAAALLLCLTLRKWPVSNARMWIGITVYSAVSAFLLQHLFKIPYSFLLLFVLHPFLAFGFLYFPTKLLVAVGVFLIVSLIRGKTVLDPFNLPIKQQTYKRVILVGVDALSPDTIQQLRREKKLRAIDSIFANGVHGRLATLSVPFSPLVWNTIYTGTPPNQHGVMGFTFTDVAGGPPFLSLWLDNWTNSDWSHRAIDALRNANALRTMSPANSRSRRQPALWNLINENKASALIVGGWTTFPPEKIQGTFISDYAFNAKHGTIGVYHPVQKQIDDLLRFQADTKQWPKDMHRYIGRDLKVHHTAMNLLREQNDSERSVFTFAYYSSPDAFGHHYGRMIGLSATSDAKRREYLKMRDNVYQMIDQFLQDYLEIIDDETLLIVCSDHGFHYDKRQHNYAVDGTIVLYGKGVRKNLEIRGDVYAIAPTVLYALGMPRSKSFLAMPLKQAFEGAITQPDSRIYSYHPQFFEVTGQEDLDEDKLRELEDLQYIQK